MYIRTCHVMYKSKDGLNHQANMTIVVRESDMEVTDSHYWVSNSTVGYVSHSFNQFIMVDSDKRIISVDHGDARPRSIDLMIWPCQAGDEIIRGYVSEYTIQSFLGDTGNNTTGASVGGLAETKNGYVIAYNYVEGFDGPFDDDGASNVHRKVYFAYLNKNNNTLTKKAVSASGTATPMLAPTGLDGGYILWNSSRSNSWADNSADSKLYYARYSADGSIGEVKTAEAPLSDCQPIAYKDNVVWYTTDNSTPTFYVLGKNGVISVRANGSLPTIDKNKFTVDTTPETYDGKPKTKKVTSDLVEGEDYTVKYSDNVNAGTATITITPFWPYSGELTYHFTIKKADRNLVAKAAGGKAQLYVGGSAGSIELEDNASAEDTSYTYTSSDTSVITVDANGAVKPVGVGKASVTVHAKETANYKEGESSVAFSVSSLPLQELEFSQGDKVERTYGDAPFTNKAINNSAGGGEITYVSSDLNVAAVNEMSGEVTVKGAGEATVTATAAGVDGVYGSTSISYTLTVAPKAVKITGAEIADKTYDGTVEAVVTGVSFAGAVPGETLSRNKDYSVAAEFADANAGSQKDVNVVVTLTNENYILTDGRFTAKGNISKAAARALKQEVSLRIEEGYTRTLDLSGIVGWPDDMGGEPVLRLDKETGYVGLSRVSLTGTTLTLTSNGEAENKSSENVAVSITGMGNYEDSSVTVTVEHVDKVPVTISGVTVSDQVYNGNAIKYSGSPVVTNEATGDVVAIPNEELEFTWIRENGDTGADLTGAPSDAGKYRLVIAVAQDSEYYGQTSIEFSITKAPLTVKPRDLSIYVGDDLPTKFELVYSGFVNGEDAGVLTIGGDEPAFLLKDGDSVLENSDADGKYIIEWTNKDAVKIDARNYDISKKDGALTIDQVYIPSVPDKPIEPNGNWKNPFTDIDPDAYYIPAIRWALEKGITTGTGDGTTFEPAKNVSRAEAVTFIWRTQGSPKPTSKNNPFTDVKEGEWYYDAVLWAVEKGITNGTSATTFEPATPVVRGSVATLLWRTLGKPGDTNITDPGLWYVDAERWAKGRDMFDGTPAPYSTYSSCPRCDVVYYLWKVLA